MGLKQRSEKLFRGWLPKETKTTVSFEKTTFQASQQPQTKQDIDTLSATKWQIAFTAIFSFFAIFYLIRINSEMTLSVFTLSWVIAGVTAGIIFGGLVTRRQLTILAEKKVLKTSLATILLLIGVAVIFIGLSVSVSTALPTNILYALLSALVTSGITAAVTRCLLLVVFERRKKRRIFQYWTKGGLFTEPSDANDEEGLNK